MAKLLPLRPKNLCICLIALALITLILCFQYQNGGQGPLSSRVSAAASAGLLSIVGEKKLLPNRKSEFDRSNEEDHKSEAFPTKPALHRDTTRSWSIRPNGSLAKNANVCSVRLEKRQVDIETAEVFAKKLDFSNVDSKYWSLEWEERWRQRISNQSSPALKVIVLPHSHNDPGWLQTFEMYFQHQTADILNNAVNFLDNHKDFRFVWSEISFFARWWRSLDSQPQLRSKVKRLVARGQLEILTGGWVMTDEAGVHLYSMLDQLVEGHHWIQHHLGDVALPKNGWSIDPFGHGNAMPYLLRRSGIYNTFIQRTHYAWKRYLADHQQLEFLWETSFRRVPTTPSSRRKAAQPAQNKSSKKNRGNIMCHMAPFDLYSIKHTCGPDTSVCLRFDFRLLNYEHSESRAEFVSPDNLHQLAVDLVDQYSKLGSLFSHNVALVLLGDDFRYDKLLEWKQQYANYRKLFDYVNKNDKLFNDTHIAFGTLADYWNEVYRRQTKFPTLSGDFMPYGDVYSEGVANYWTGYYTTRPFLKQLARELQHYLRAAEIIYTLGRQHLLGIGGHEQLRSRIDTDYALLNKARSQLAIFQHHDAVTGTSKSFVMNDYGERLFEGISDSQSVIAHIVQYLQTKDKPGYELRGDQAPFKQQMPFKTYLRMSERRTSFDTLPARVPLWVSTNASESGRKFRKRIQTPAKIVVINSHAAVVYEAIRVHLNGPVQRVLGPDGRECSFQLNPVWEYVTEVMTGLYELLFIAQLAPLSTTTFQVIGQAPGEKSAMLATSVKVFLSDAWAPTSSPPVMPTLSNGHIFNFETTNAEDITITNDQLHAVFARSTGLLKSVNGRPVSMSFGAYRSEDFHSGAYLFRPSADQPRMNITGRFPVIRLVQGPLVSEVIVVYRNIVMQRARIYHKDPSGVLTSGIELETSFDLSVAKDFMEMYMTLESDVASGQEFFTDSAGFETVRRIRNDLLPVEANYYPMTESVFIQDDSSRLTVLCNHAHGVTSIKPGHVEVMLDRRLRFDDARGLSESVVDNRHTRSHFWLLFESREAASHTGADKRQADVPSLSRTAHRLAMMMNFPPVVLQSLWGGDQREVLSELKFLAAPPSCDMYVVNIRTFPKEGDELTFYQPSMNQALLVVHNRAPDCSVKTPPGLACSTGAPHQGFAFTNVSIESVEMTSLTGTARNEPKIFSEEIDVAPHELESFLIKFAEKNGTTTGKKKASTVHIGQKESRGTKIST